MRTLIRVLILIAPIAILSACGYAERVARPSLPAGHVTSVQLVERGVYSLDKGRRIAQPKTAAGHTTVPENIVLEHDTDRVPAILGMSFGLRFVADGAPAGGQFPYTVVVEFPAPGLKNPRTGKVHRRQEHTGVSQIGRVTFEGFSFAKRWEIVPGEWTFRVMVGDEPLLEQTFEVSTDPRALITTALGDLLAGDSQTFIAMLDMERFAGRVLEPTKLSSTLKQSFRDMLLSREEAVVQNLAGSLTHAVATTHLRTRSAEAGYLEALFRVEFDDGSVMYHEYLFDPRTAQIVDWHDYAIGRSVSEGMRSITMLAARARALDASTAHIYRLASMATHMSNGDMAKAIDLYRAAPRDFQRLDASLALMLIAATAPNGRLADYEFALETLARNESNNPRFALLLVDYYVLRGKYDKAIEAAHVFQQRLGMAESGMEEIIAALYLLQGNAGMAITHYERSAKAEPQRDAPYAMLFELYATSGHYEAAQTMLELLNRHFDYGMTVDDLANIPAFHGYVRWARETPTSLEKGV